jgi:hypothetical protein
LVVGRRSTVVDQDQLAGEAEAAVDRPTTNDRRLTTSDG